MLPRTKPFASSSSLTHEYERVQQEELFRGSQPHREYTQSSHAIVVPVSEDCEYGQCSMLRDD